MTQTQLSGLVLMPLMVAAVGCQPAPEPEPEPAPIAEMVVPQFEVDPSAATRRCARCGPRWRR